jgi:VCBS repeat-containing protein
MRNLVKILLLSSFLLACSTTDNAHYRDISTLERPPVMASSRPSSEQRVTDDSVIPKQTNEKGLGTAVYLSTETPAQLRIKQPVEQAWHTLNQALELNDIKITDHERNKGHIYVNYDGHSLFDGALSFLNAGQKETSYLLSIVADGAETVISVSLNGASEQSKQASNPDGYYETPDDASEALLKKLYVTLRDDVVGK